jgi:hypothetical protein
MKDWEKELEAASVAYKYIEETMSDHPEGRNHEFVMTSTAKKACRTAEKVGAIAFATWLVGGGLTSSLEGRENISTEELYERYQLSKN